MTTIRSFVLLAIVGCAPKPPPAGSGSAQAPAGVSDCVEPDSPACNRVDCGANSPIVNTFPIGGVRPDGECNNDGQQLMPGTLAGGSDACAGSTLSMRDNVLVGLTPDGKIATKDGAQCTGTALKGARFQIRSWVPQHGPKQAITVHIADVVPAYQIDDHHAPRMAYRLVDDDGNSLCTAAGSTTARKNLGLAPLVGLTDPGPGKDLVIPVRSELYDFNGNSIPVSDRWKVKEPEWLHLACVDDALAKRSLYNLETDNAVTSRSALMMLIANYCGNLHATMRGAQIEWDVEDDAVTAMSSTSKILEAKWAPGGAVCVSNPRALYQQGPERQLPRDPQGDLRAIVDRCPTCTTPDAWTAKVLACDTYADTPPVPAARPVCKDCTGDTCKGFHLVSYVIPAPATAR